MMLSAAYNDAAVSVADDVRDVVYSFHSLCQVLFHLPSFGA